MKLNARPMTTPVLWLAVLALTLLAAMPARTRAQQEDSAHGGDPATAQSSEVHKPGAAVQAPRVTEDWTERGLIRNPIALSFDPNGNLYLCEAWRAGNAVLDNRWGPLQETDGVTDDLQKTSVQDRARQIEMLIEKGYYTREFFTKEADKVRFVQDTDGDGKADRATVFADGFNDELDGIAAGVLWHEGKVYLTNIPHVWLLEDKDGDGDADESTEGERVSLSYGWGVRWAFYGHDLHGLILGPDGRIYFSMADRGFNVTTREGKHLYGPERGAVFRMWPDGSGLEMVFQGLRNPQELAFDNYGNLFTGDNNCDAGDLARFVYLPEGGDSGWRQDVQSLDSRGPWMRERMWAPRMGKDDLTQPAWIIHPIANVGRGPSGLAHYPGTGDAFEPNGSFLLCDFPPGVRHVQTRPDGASFRVVEDSVFVDGQTITDIAWGYDGRLYLADWGGGWESNPNGYIKTMTNQAAHAEQAAVIAQVQELFANGFDSIADDKLLELLGHRDQRVRLAAQYEAAKRPLDGPLAKLLLDPDALELSRLHALWTLGMMSRTTIEYVVYIEAAIKDKSANVRAQAASVLGDIGYPLTDIYIELLNDESPIVQHHAALALGKTHAVAAIGPLFDLLERNDDNDVVVRHAASYALSLIGDAEAINDQAKRRGPAARLGAVLALRRLDSLLLSEYLDDEDPLVAAEAARAVYDRRVMDAFPALAKLAETLPPDRMTEPVMRRVIEANVRLADAESAERLARLAANKQAPDGWRVLAIRELDAWAAQRNREGVWGHWWPRDGQSMDQAMPALAAYLPLIAADAQGEVRSAARISQLRHFAPATPGALSATARNTQEPDELRLAAALRLAVDDPDAAVLLTSELTASADASAGLKNDLRELLLRLDVNAAMDSYLLAVRAGAVSEKQAAVNQFATMDRPEAADVIKSLAGELATGTLDPALRLDVYRVASESDDITIKAAAARYAQQQQAPGEVFLRDAVLAGGSVEQGRKLFNTHESAQCQRCHGIDGAAASVGPALSTIGSLRPVDYLYRALTNPHADIAEGFATTTVTLKTNAVKTGRVVEQTPSKIVLADADGNQTEVKVPDIQSMITSDQSMMPTMNDKLKPAELRDILAYLVSLQDPAKGPAKPGQGGSHAHGPAGHVMMAHLISPALGMKHVVWLPGILLGICAALGLLLGATVLAGKA